MNRIITINREFGSGGRELGRLSEKLGFAYYDQEIIQEIARRTSLSEQYVQAIVEHRPAFSYHIHIGHSFYPASNQPFEQTVSIYQEQMCRLHPAGPPALPRPGLRQYGEQAEALPGERPR